MAKQLSDFLKKNHETLKEVFLFLLVFSLLSLSLHFVLWVNLDTTNLQELTALITSYILSIFGLLSYSEGINIGIKNFGIVRIIRDCLAWKSILAFSALVIASRKIEWRKKFYGILIGSVLIVVLNFVRLTTTILMVYHWNWSFEIVHTFLWQWSLTLIVLALWVLWLKWVKN